MLKFKSIKHLHGDHLLAKKTELEEVLSGKRDYLPIYQVGGIYVVDFGTNSIVHNIMDDEIVIPVSRMVHLKNDENH